MSFVNYELIKKYLFKISNMKEIVITCALFVAVIFIPALFFAGIQIAYEYGDYSFLIISFPLLISLICYFIFIFVPQKKRQEALRKMHNYPECLQFECGDQWGKTFQIQISKALDNITDLNKKRIYISAK